MQKQLINLIANLITLNYTSNLNIEVVDEESLEKVNISKLIKEIEVEFKKEFWNQLINKYYTTIQ